MSLPSTRKRRSRRRRMRHEARTEALASARRLFLERGPDAVTLKAVAADLGMTHTNLLHHFGSAVELRKALMDAMADDLNAALLDAVKALQTSETAAARVQTLVDNVFDAFGRGGAGRLGAWLALTGNFAHFEHAEGALNSLVETVEEIFARKNGDAHRAVTSAVLLLLLCAFADSVAGAALVEMLGRERMAARKAVVALLPRLF